MLLICWYLKPLNVKATSQNYKTIFLFTVHTEVIDVKHVWNRKLLTNIYNFYAKFEKKSKIMLFLRDWLTELNLVKNYLLSVIFPIVNYFGSSSGYTSKVFYLSQHCTIFLLFAIFNSSKIVFLKLFLLSFLNVLPKVT